jgi:hypothetical protein
MPRKQQAQQAQEQAPVKEKTEEQPLNINTEAAGKMAVPGVKSSGISNSRLTQNLTTDESLLEGLSDPATLINDPQLQMNPADAAAEMVVLGRVEVSLDVLNKREVVKQKAIRLHTNKAKTAEEVHDFRRQVTMTDRAADNADHEIRMTGHKKEANRHDETVEQTRVVKWRAKAKIATAEMSSMLNVDPSLATPEGATYTGHKGAQAPQSSESQAVEGEFVT